MMYQLYLSSILTLKNTLRSKLYSKQFYIFTRKCVENVYKKKKVS